MSYVDLHLHLLPGVDDGARTEQEALRYAHRLALEGVRDVVATPHVRAGDRLDLESLADRVADLQRAIDAHALGIRVRSGGEIHPRRGPLLHDAELELVAQGPPGARWVLVEVPFDGLDEAFGELCDDLRARGFGTVIAHPERAAGVLGEGRARLEAELRAGGLLQVNVCSLLGQHGLAVQEAAVQLLRDGHAHLLASDAHPGSREHTLRLGFELALKAGASSVQA